MKTFKLTALFILLSGSFLYAGNNSMQFSDMDKDKNGFVSDSEFTQVKANKMQTQLDQGKQLKNAGTSPTFSDIDTNKDGKVSKEELTLKQNSQMQKNMQSKKGKGQKMNKGKQGQRMGKGSRNQ